MPIGRRLAVITILFLGALTIIASIIRLVIFVYLFDEVQTSFLSQDPDSNEYPSIHCDISCLHDIIVDVSIFLYWSMLESGLAVIVACLPTLRFLLRSYPDILQSLRSIFSLTSMNGSRSNFRSIGQDSTSSQTQISDLKGNTEPRGETYILNDLESQKRYGNRGISVSRDLSIHEI